MSYNCLLIKMLKTSYNNDTLIAVFACLMLVLIYCKIFMNNRLVEHFKTNMIDTPVSSPKSIYSDNPIYQLQIPRHNIIRVNRHPKEV